MSEDWFTGADEGHAVFYSDGGGTDEYGEDYDPLWVRLTDGPEIGRGSRSFSLTNRDLEWLHDLLAAHLGGVT